MFVHHLNKWFLLHFSVLTRDFLLLGLSQEMIDIPDFRHRAGGERGSRVGSKPFLNLIGEISKYCSQTVLGDVTITIKSCHEVYSVCSLGHTALWLWTERGEMRCEVTLLCSAFFIFISQSWLISEQWTMPLWAWIMHNRAPWLAAGSAIHTPIGWT